MRKEKQELFTQACVNTESGWNRAIVEAERQIEDSEKKIKRLKLSIATFREMLAKGDPFPGEDTEQGASEAA